MVTLNKYKSMKHLLYLFVVFLVGCDGKSSTLSLEDHVKDKREEIQSAIDRFERSGYKKISFGPPDFLTFMDSDGYSREVSVDVGAMTGGQGGVSTLELDAAKYIKLFSRADIRCIERGIGLYVDFPEGRRLLVSNGDAKMASQILQGKRYAEAYPGWYTFIE
jgi:hypothetical protein